MHKQILNISLKTENLSALESLEMITNVIQEARYRFEESGFTYVVWGILVAIGGIGQYTLLRVGLYEINYYPYFLMPLGGLITYLHYRKKQDFHQNNPLIRAFGYMWILLSINMSLLGFLFFPQMGVSLIPVLLVMMGIGTIVSGVSVQSTLIWGAGLLINMAGLICFKLPFQEQPLLLGIIGLLAMFLPGILLMQKQRKANV